MSSLRLPIALAVVSALALPAASAAAATQGCSDSDRFLQQLQATNLHCRVANRLMFRWARSSACIGGGDGRLAARVRPCTIFPGYRCLPRKAEGGVTVRCNKGRHGIRFFDSA